MRAWFALMTLALATLIAPHAALAAIGCTLSNPAEDLKYLFPDMSSYKEDLKEFTKLPDGQGLFKALRDRLGSDLDPIYETYETPYTVYGIFKGAQKIGVVHGVNVPGKGGVIQVFLSVDPKTAAIRKFFFQRLESPAAEQLRNKDFRKQFEGLTLGDFYKHDYYAKAQPASQKDRVGRIKPPKLDENGRPDYDASIRGIRKNLILLDFFVYGRKFEPFFEKAKGMSK
ncbi:MAG: hypothetical protein HY074_03635 [Deltaproteobacteria bacterium]|nr:hypothetical protein [Deltaproteobacteria bacterium]